jgi:hypothetical protein
MSTEKRPFFVFLLEITAHFDFFLTGGLSTARLKLGEKPAGDNVRPAYGIFKHTSLLHAQLRGLGDRYGALLTPTDERKGPSRSKAPIIDLMQEYDRYAGKDSTLYLEAPDGSPITITAPGENFQINSNNPLNLAQALFLFGAAAEGSRSETERAFIRARLGAVEDLVLSAEHLYKRLHHQLMVQHHYGEDDAHAILRHSGLDISRDTVGKIMKKTENYFGLMHAIDPLVEDYNYLPREVGIRPLEAQLLRSKIREQGLLEIIPSPTPYCEDIYVAKTLIEMIGQKIAPESMGQLKKVEEIAIAMLAKGTGPKQGVLQPKSEWATTLPDKNYSPKDFLTHPVVATEITRLHSIADSKLLGAEKTALEAVFAAFERTNSMLPVTVREDGPISRRSK